ncbi:MAG: hypothetical protein QOK07_3387 [Gemmatimonadaceae bacterium]|jgi:hypothetical protein|nr:hypothetical protein [Gemmatimonadaceae bacterium]
MGKKVQLDLPQELWSDSVTRLGRAGRITDAEQFLTDILTAYALDALETIGGSGAVPTAVNDARAARLLQICKVRHAIPSEDAVQAIFRVMSATATTILNRMQGTYGASLETYFTEHMRASAKLSSPKKNPSDPAQHRVRFTDTAALRHALTLISAAGLRGEVEVDNAATAITFPKKVTTSSATGEAEEIAIATEVLGLS